MDLRQLGLPFKGMQNYTPASEIDASIASHSPLNYKVHVCDIPRPDYTGLRLTPKDAELSSDPRLKKIFRVAVITEKDSPASPKPAAAAAVAAAAPTPTSPKPPRQDPRRRNIPPEDKPDLPLSYNQQLQLLQNSAFYQSLTSNQKLMLNQEIASKGEQSPHNDPILSGILSSLGLIPNQAHNAPALNILNNVNSLVPPMMNPQMPPNLPNIPNISNIHPNIPHPMGGMPPPPQLMQNPMGPNLGPGLLGAAPEYPINFDPRNGGLLGQAPFQQQQQQQQQNFNENPNFPPYNSNEPHGGFHPRPGNFRGDRGGGNNRRGGGGRNWGQRHNNRNFNNRNMNRNRTNRSYTPP